MIGLISAFALFGAGPLTALCDLAAPDWLYELDVVACHHPRPHLERRLREWDKLSIINRVLARNRVVILEAKVLRALRVDCRFVGYGQNCKTEISEVEPSENPKWFYIPADNAFLCEGVKKGRRFGYVPSSCDDRPGLDSTSYWFGVPLLSDLPDRLSYVFSGQDE